MATSVRSFGKINLGLLLGPPRADGYHDLRTCYQTIALHDVIKVERQRGTGVEVRARGLKRATMGEEAAAALAAKVPLDESNSCYRIVEKLLRHFRLHLKVVVTIEKALPVQGGMGAASSNAVAALLAVERELKVTLEPEARYAMCAEIGSDVPQFLVGGLSLGTGRGEQVFPLPDLEPLACAIVTPDVGVSTPAAFAAWDAHCASQLPASSPRGTTALTDSAQSSKLNGFSHTIYRWLSHTYTGVPTGRSQGPGNLAEAQLLDLVRTGVSNDFEQVVFPQHPELREIKRALEHAGACFASLSGSGSALFGLFGSTEEAAQAVSVLARSGHRAFATATLPRREYWQQFWAK